MVGLRARNGTFAAAALIGVILFPVIDATAQRVESVEDYLSANYTRGEHYAPMRDGEGLFTAVFVPKDTTKTYPILLERTPFGAGAFGGDYNRGQTGPNVTLLREGYIVVRQEVRGTYRSGGTYSYITPHIADKKPGDVDESTDTYDTIEWLLANVPHHNGRVGLWGIDYAGFSAVAGMIGAHPALKAVSPQAPVVDPWSGTLFSGGAFKPAHALRFVMDYGESVQGQQMGFNGLDFHTGTDWYKFLLELGSLSYIDRLYLQGRRALWNECVAHPAYDQFWQSRNVLPYLSKTAPAVMTVGGWFDDENVRGAFDCYRAIEDKNPGVFNMLVVGPWDDAGWLGRYDAQDGLGNISFGSNTAAFFQENIELQFFEHFLKDKGQEQLPEAYVFETGANTWRAFDRWPPVEALSRKLYLHEGGRLADEAPAGPQDAWDEFVSDPANPVPIAGQTSIWPPPGFMVADQRFLAGRVDVLVYTSDAFDRDVTVAGPLEAVLWVSTSEGDADWVVKLIDVLPPEGDEQFPERVTLRGYQMLVRAGVLRGRFRESAEAPEPFVAGKATKISVELDDVCHTFRKGHRIMIHIQSSWLPFFDRNPQRYVENIFEAADDDFTEAVHRVYRSPERASYVELGVLSER